MSEPRPTLPSLSAIAAAWENLGFAELASALPGAALLGVGFGEPICFRCGWLAPVSDVAARSATWSPDRAFQSSWDSARGWLERAHLHDHRFGGPSDPLNLVPLCVLCHERQPACQTRADGLRFVNDRTDNPRVLAITQWLTDERYRNMRNPGKSKALRALLRARSDASAALLEASEAAGRNV